MKIMKKKQLIMSKNKKRDENCSRVGIVPLGILSLLFLCNVNVKLKNTLNILNMYLFLTVSQSFFHTFFNDIIL